MVGNRPVGWIRGVADSASISQGEKEQQHLGLALLRLAECESAVADGDALWVDLSGASDIPKVAPAIGSSDAQFVKPFAPFWWPEDIAPGLPRIDFKSRSASGGIRSVDV